MTEDNYQSSQYVVTAKTRDGVIQQTRVRAASAGVLAKSWIASGYSGVEIVDPLGKPIHPEGYRRAIMGDGKPGR